MRKSLILMAVGLALGIVARGQDAQKAVVTRYCAGCHNDKLKSGNFSWCGKSGNFSRRYRECTPSTNGGQWPTIPFQNEKMGKRRDDDTLGA